jgi:uncharacterized membrane protein
MSKTKDTPINLSPKTLTTEEKAIHKRAEEKGITRAAAAEEIAREKFAEDTQKESPSDE